SQQDVEITPGENLWERSKRKLDTQRRSREKTMEDQIDGSQGDDFELDELIKSFDDDEIKLEENHIEHNSKATSPITEEKKPQNPTQGAATDFDELEKILDDSNARD